MALTLTTGLLVLAIIFWVLCMVGHGYANTIDWIALALHRHAKKVMASHDDRGKDIKSRWKMENCPEDQYHA